MNPVKVLYRAITPARLREFAARQRYAVWNALTGPAARERATRWNLALGRPVRPVRTPYGTVYADLRDEGVGRLLYVNRGFEPHEVGFVVSRLRPGMTFLDIGANVGCYTVAAAATVGPTGRVISIEPDDHNFALLNRAVTANRFKSVTLVNAAAGAEPGTARLYKSGHNLGDHRLYADGQSDGRRAIDVPVVRLDDVFAERALAPPDVVKIDVQGFELAVMRGAARLFAGDRPMTVLTEFWPHGITSAGGDPAGYLGFFRDRGFTCRHIAADGRLTPTDWDDVWGLVPPVDPAVPDHAMTNLVFTRTPPVPEPR